MSSPIFLHRFFAALSAACLAVGALLPLCGPAPFLFQAQAAAAVAVDQNGGYAGKMLEKIMAVWAPPPALKGDFVVRLKVRVDGRGMVTDCTPLRSSGMEALDISACGAVRQGSGYGTPPYAQPLEVHLAFWTGTPKGKPNATPPSSKEALRAEVRARTKAEATMGDTRAAAAEARARERAEALAREMGGTTGPAAVSPPPVPDTTAALPKTPPTPAAASSTPPSALKTTPPVATPPAPTGRPVAPKPITAQVTPQPIAPNTAAADTAETHENAAGQPVPTVPPHPKKASSGTPDATDRRSYLSAVSRRLREHIVIPAETTPGTYRVPLRLEVDSQSGEIKDFTVLQDTGDKLLDRYVRLGIRRAGSVPVPPPGMGGTLEFTLVLLRP